MKWKWLIMVLFLISLNSVTNVARCDIRSSSEEFVQITFDENIDWDPAWSPDGSRIAFSSNSSGTFDIWVINADGSNLVQTTSGPEDDSCPTWSPDSSKIAFSRGGGEKEKGGLWIVNADGTNPTQITTFLHSDMPSWSPDGQKIVFAGEQEGRWNLWIVNADGTGLQQFTHLTDQDAWHPCWSLDGTRIAFTTSIGEEWNIAVVDADGSNMRTHIAGCTSTGEPSWSPDGEKIAFEHQSMLFLRGRIGIYTVDPDRTGWPPYPPYPRPLIVDRRSNNYDPCWSPDGGRIVFTSDRSGNYDIWIYTIK